MIIASYTTYSESLKQLTKHTTTFESKKAMYEYLNLVFGKNFVLEKVKEKKPVAA